MNFKRIWNSLLFLSALEISGCIKMVVIIMDFPQIKGINSKRLVSYFSVLDPINYGASSKDESQWDYLDFSALFYLSRKTKRPIVSKTDFKKRKLYYYSFDKKKVHQHIENSTHINGKLSKSSSVTFRSVGCWSHSLCITTLWDRPKVHLTLGRQLLKSNILVAESNMTRLNIDLLILVFHWARRDAVKP